MNWFNNRKQFEFWKLRRSRMSNTAIAVSFGISRQAVSKALLKADGRVEIALRDMARANRIAIMKTNPKLGVLLGRSVPLGADAMIFISSKHGLQVWYEHDGDCGSCDEYSKCIELLWDYAGELGIALKGTADPSEMAEELFNKVKEMI